MPITITPKYYMNGWRILRSTEEVEEGDYYWSHNKKGWFSVAKRRIGNLAIQPYTFVRKENNCTPGHLPKSTRILGPSERIRRGDLYWAVHQRLFKPCPKSILGVKAGSLATVIREEE